MRIPTYINSKQQTEMLTRQYELINRIQVKINSGKKLIDSSDDPVLAHSIKATKDYINHLDAYKSNLVMAQSRAKLMEGGVTGSINAITRASELIKAAQSDTVSNADRQNMAKELDGILNSLMGYANTKDVNGDYIFSGTNPKAQAFADVNGVYTYLGNNEQGVVYVSPSMPVVYNENGQHVFGDIQQGNGVVMIHQGTTANAGTAEISVSTITNSSSYHGDTYTIKFVTNGAGKLAYEITGANAGQIIPAPPQTSPADAPEYVPGTAITVDGINFSIKGQPVVGDGFEISPSKKENIFETLKNVINLLRKPINNEVDKAAYHQSLGELSATVNGAGTYLTHYLSEIGYREKEIENQGQISDADILRQKSILEKFESADQVELISELTQSMTAMQLTQQAHAKLQEFFQNLLKNII